MEATPDNVGPCDPLPNARKQLLNLFGTYRAEWFQDELYDLFTEPAYFPELTGPGPCVLTGGRGTGKTTVLRGMSYEGEWARVGADSTAFDARPFLGFYFKADPNRVTQFTGRGVAQEDWVRYFGHYLNLVFAELVLTFLRWHAVRCPTAPALMARDVQRLATSLNVGHASDLPTLHEAVVDGIIQFEAFINNAGTVPAPALSLQGAAIEYLFTALHRQPQFAAKRFFLLIDEFENLLDYEQQIFNTLLKHSGEHYTFKIGVKELGWRVRTIQGGEVLRDLTDFSTINIADKLEPTFSDFAARVCNDRVSRLELPATGRLGDVRELFPSPTLEEEAKLLGVDEALGVYASMIAKLAPKSRAIVAGMPSLRAYLLLRWAATHRQPPSEAIEEMRRKPAAFDARYNNYGYAYLFTIRRGRRGIRKYYAGWDTYTQLAATNIRLLLELVDRALQEHLGAGMSGTSSVSFETQTQAAQAIGRLQLDDLAGLSLQGGRLTKLVLGLGRIFQVMAAKPDDHAPELNQFTITDPNSVPGELGLLITASVTNLALLRQLGNKLGSDSDIRDFDYRLHPIFAPVFEFSHRRKRKMKLSSRDLKGLLDDPPPTITRILSRHHRTEMDVELPDQLRLFDAYVGPSA